MAKSPKASFWQQRASWLAWFVNFAWLWQSFMPYFVITNLLFAGYILVARRNELALSEGLIIYFIVLVLGLSWTLYRVRGRFYRKEDAYVRIETALELNSSLSSAQEGASDWPEPEVFRPQVLGLRPHIAMLPVVYSFLFIVVGLWMPVGQAQAQLNLGDAVEPTAWTEVNDWAELLREEQLVAPEAADKLEERLNELRDRPKDEWYTQGSLEAGEALRDETKLAMQELAKRLQSTGSLLEEMSKQQANPTLAASEAKELDEALLKQLQELQMSELSLDPEMLNQLKGLSFSEMNSLSSEQLAELSKKLKQCSGNCAGASGLNELELEKVVIQLGNGGINRGPGPAPLVMLDDGTALETEAIEGISNTDMRNATLGDTIAVSSRPGNDSKLETFQAGQQSGGAAQLGEGGDVVWQESYTPQEQALLERYFK